LGKENIKWRSYRI